VIILDTNVLSALMRTSPDMAVVSWLNRQPADSILMTSVTLFEARFGLAMLPQGKRRLGLERAFEKSWRKTSQTESWTSIRSPPAPLLASPRNSSALDAALTSATR
jgi:predicted nucleic acid-binding protein